MKKLLLLLLAIVTMTSCQLTEEVTFNEDGSGTYVFKVDMSAMMAMKGNKDKISDSTQTREPEKIDSLIHVKDLLKKYKDSIENLTPEEKAFIKRMENATMHIQVDEANNKMLMAYSIPFNSVEDLTNIGEDIHKMDRLKKEKEGQTEKNPVEDMFNGVTNSKIKYVFNKHKFSRKVTVLKKKKKEEKEEDKDSKDEDLDNQIAEMMKMMNYKIIYHFPYKIKKVSYKDALLSPDGKTLIIEASLDQMDKNPKLLDFDVIFE